MGEFIIAQAVAAIILYGFLRTRREMKYAGLSPLCVLVNSGAYEDYLEGCIYFLQREMSKNRIQRALHFGVDKPGGQACRILEILAVKSRIITWEINEQPGCAHSPVLDLRQSVLPGQLQRNIREFLKGLSQ